MSLDVFLNGVYGDEDALLYEGNITHNLNKMAEAAGIYKELWRPEELGITKAEQLIAPLTEGLKRLKEHPGYYILMNPSNDWGNYKQFVEFVDEYLYACMDHPYATITVSR